MKLRKSVSWLLKAARRYMGKSTGSHDAIIDARNDFGITRFLPLTCSSPKLLKELETPWWSSLNLGSPLGLRDRVRPLPSEVALPPDVLRPSLRPGPPETLRFGVRPPRRTSSRCRWRGDCCSFATTLLNLCNTLSAGRALRHHAWHHHTLRKHPRRKTSRNQHWLWHSTCSRRKPGKAPPNPNMITLLQM